LAPAFNPNAFDDVKKPLWRNRASPTLRARIDPEGLQRRSRSGVRQPVAQNDVQLRKRRYRIGKNTVHDVHRYGLLTLQTSSSTRATSAP